MKEAVIHCSDTPNGRPHTAEDIHRWHREFGWAGVGYHYVIRLDGTVDHGRPEYWEGSHCRGHNDKIGICLIGRDKFTAAQEEALIFLLTSLGHDALTTHMLHGHCDLDPKKTCPNFDVRQWWNSSVYPWPLLEE